MTDNLSLLTIFLSCGMGNGEGPTGASTQKRTELPLPHVLSHLHLQAIHLKLIPVLLLYPVDFFKQLLDTSLTLRARHLAVGHGFSHLAILANRPSIHVGAQCL